MLFDASFFFLIIDGRPDSTRVFVYSMPFVIMSIIAKSCCGVRPEITRSRGVFAPVGDSCLQIKIAPNPPTRQRPKNITGAIIASLDHAKDLSNWQFCHDSVAVIFRNSASGPPFKLLIREPDASVMTNTQCAEQGLPRCINNCSTTNCIISVESVNFKAYYRVTFKPTNASPSAILTTLREFEIYKYVSWAAITKPHSHEAAYCDWVMMADA